MEEKASSQRLPSQYAGCAKNTCEHGNENIVSKSKIIASHCVTLITILMFKFTYGLESGFPTIIIPELYKPDAEIYVTRDQLTWFSSYYFMQPVGAIVGGFLTQFIGCRMLLVITGLLYIGCGLIFHWSANAAMILSAQAIIGFTGGMQKGPCYTYLAEIALPQYRSFLMGFAGMIVLFGHFVMTTLGSFLYWRTVVFIYAIFCTIGLILIFFLPESPYWLASQNRYEDAVRSLAWFRGWTSPDCVKDEMRAILGNIDDNLPSPKNTNLTSRFKRMKETSKQFFERPFYIPFLIMIFIFAVNNFNGTMSLKTFSVVVFDKMDCPIDPHTAAVIISATAATAGIISIVLLNIAGKRKLLLITLSCSGFCLIVFAVFNFLTSTNMLANPAYRWIPTISLIIAELFNSIGISKLCFYLNSEIFPLQVRHIGVGAGHFINTIAFAVMNKLFLYVIDVIALSGVFLIFAIINIAGFIGVYFTVPETEGKSLKEIEELYGQNKHKEKLNEIKL